MCDCCPVYSKTDNSDRRRKGPKWRTAMAVKYNAHFEDKRKKLHFFVHLTTWFIYCGRGEQNVWEGPRYDVIYKEHCNPSSKDEW